VNWLAEFLLLAEPGSHKMPENHSTKRIPINQIRQEEGAREFAESADMEPHLKYFAVALMQVHDPAPELERFASCRSNGRYMWRITSALKWGFADFDNLGVDAGRRTLSPGRFRQGHGTY
jgi:hypothetical protein